MKNAEFYTGYGQEAPPGIARFVKKTIVVLVFFSLITAIVLVTHQRKLGPSHHEFGVVREFEGTLIEQPVPLLAVPRPGQPPTSFSIYYLVNPMKFGARESVVGFAGKNVRIKGSLIYRDQQTMIELDPSQPIQVLENEAKLFRWQEHPRTPISLIGEIVDAKCYFGVMKPGNLKTHKACAIRCIAGGIPPVFLVRDQQGFAQYYLLLGSDGRTLNQEVLTHVAEPLRIKGEITQLGSIWVLYTEPREFVEL